MLAERRRIVARVRLFEQRRGSRRQPAGALRAIPDRSQGRQLGRGDAGTHDRF